MSEPYNFPTLWINGRFVRIEHILSGEEPSLTDFEDSTFSFIKAWNSGQQEFEISTSGSTGAPKKIIITRDQMIASASATIRKLNIKKGESCLVCIDTKYIGGRMMLVRALAFGLQIFAVDPCANPVEKLPAGQWVNFTAFVPYQLETILASNNFNLLSSFEKIIIGGAPLHSNTIASLKNTTCQLYATYGMTETISHVALRKLNGEGKQEFFETLPGITVDLDLRECLTFSVPYLPDRIVTNDVGVRLSPNQFIWTGRFDNIINTGGIKVSPEKVETAIHNYFSSTGHTFRFFVHGVSDRLLGSRVVLVIESNILDEEFLKSLHMALAAVLPPYEIPKEALLVSQFSETANGKINRLQTVKGFHAIVSLKK